MTLLGDVEICHWIPDLVPDWIFAGISFQNKGEDNSKALVFPLPANFFYMEDPPSKAETPEATNGNLLPWPPTPTNSRAQGLSLCSEPRCHRFQPLPQVLDVPVRLHMLWTGRICSSERSVAGRYCSLLLEDHFLLSWEPFDGKMDSNLVQCFSSRKLWDDADPNI